MALHWAVRHGSLLRQNRNNLSPINQFTSKARKHLSKRVHKHHNGVGHWCAAVAVVVSVTQANPFRMASTKQTKSWWRTRLECTHLSVWHCNHLSVSDECDTLPVCRQSLTWATRVDELKLLCVVDCPLSTSRLDRHHTSMNKQYPKEIWPSRSMHRKIEWPTWLMSYLGRQSSGVGVRRARPQSCRAQHQSGNIAR